MERTLRGLAIAPGIAIGAASILVRDGSDVPRYAVTDVKGELARLDKAVDQTRNDLTQLYERTLESAGKAHAGIFQAHLLVLDDVVFREDIASRLRLERVNIEAVIAELSRHYASQITDKADPLFRERTAELLDVLDRMLGYLLESERASPMGNGDASILVAQALTPADTVDLPKGAIVGLALEAGNITSHTAILARAFEIPTVMGLDRVLDKVTPDSVIIVDGSAGLAIVDPSPETLAHYREAASQYREQAEKLREPDRGPARMDDGSALPLYANVALPLEVAQAKAAGAEGIGLYRTEYLFINRTTPPSEDEQFAAYDDAAAAFYPAPVILRTMDVGSDKTAASLAMTPERNPQLGWRAVRYSLAHPELFRTQLRAMLRASTRGNVRIMFPMVSGVEELRKVKTLCLGVMEDLDAAGVAFDAKLPMGAMIEVPSAVAVVDLLAAECDFLSIGTNDLIQYSLAVDRVNEKIAYMYEPAHPAIVRMIRATTQAAQAAGIPCGICGEMAGDPLFTELLAGLGVSSLSMSSVSIPSMRSRIASFGIDSARALADEALGLATARDVRRHLEARLAASLGDLDAVVASPAQQDTMVTRE